MSERPQQHQPPSRQDSAAPAQQSGYGSSFSISSIFSSLFGTAADSSSSSASPQTQPAGASTSSSASSSSSSALSSASRGSAVTQRPKTVPSLPAPPGAALDSQSASLVLNRLFKHHRQSYDYISRAVALDEAGSHATAGDLYLKGISELRAGLSIRFDKTSTPDCTSEELGKAALMQSKMEATLAQANERLRELRAKTTPQASSAASAKSRSPAAASSSSAASARSSLPAGASGAKTQSPSSAAAAPRTTHGSTKKSSASSNGAVSIVPVAPSSASAASSSALSATSSAQQSNNLTNVDPKMADVILNEIVDNGPPITFDDVVGLEGAKQALNELVILPALRPDLFVGLLEPSRGLLMFGPPGNGKTMLAKAVAHEAKAKFFNISASTLTSKYVGDGEKMVKALFAMARELQPSIIFIDEIDSILTERGGNEHEASRRLKNEFLICFDGVGTSSKDRILVMGATNRPQDLDEAARRRMPKRVYIPLPDHRARVALLHKLLSKHRHALSDRDVYDFAAKLEGYSGSDITELAKDAAFGPIRELGAKVRTVDSKAIRPLQIRDFVAAMKNIRPSVSQESLRSFEQWNQQFGASAV